MLISATSALAAKETLQINQFTSASDVSQDELSMVRDAVAMAFSDKGRFIILTDSIPSNNPPVKFAIDGKIVRLNYSSYSSNNDNDTLFDADLSILLTITDHSTSKVQNSSVIDNKIDFHYSLIFIDFFETPHSKFEALKKATYYMAKSTRKLPKWIEENFPITGSIVKLNN